MYNPKQKERFIKSENDLDKKTAKYAIPIFNKAEPTETRLDKDLCDFTGYEIRELYMSLNTPYYNSLITINSVFSSYASWCLSNNLVADGQNHFLEMSLETLYNCLNHSLLEKRYFNREDILKSINRLPNPSDQFLLLAIFEGIKGKDFCELLNLKMSDIDDNNVVHLCTGRTFKISDELKAIAKKSSDTYEYHAITGAAGKTVPLSGDLIIKPYINVKDDVDDYQKGRRIYNKIVRVLNYLNIKELNNANSIYISGKIAYINGRAIDLGISAVEFINNYHDEIKDRYGSVNKSIFIRNYGDRLV